eukprot:5915318-Karenia_brevis.AAC.1
MGPASSVGASYIQGSKLGSLCHGMVCKTFHQMLDWDTFKYFVGASRLFVATQQFTIISISVSSHAGMWLIDRMLPQL